MAHMAPEKSDGDVWALCLFRQSDRIFRPAAVAFAADVLAANAGMSTIVIFVGALLMLRVQDTSKTVQYYPLLIWSTSPLMTFPDRKYCCIDTRLAIFN